MRLLVLLAVAMLIGWLVRTAVRRIRHTPPSSPESTARANESMHPCAHCGVYFPLSEGVGEPPGPVFCSEAHRRGHVSR